MQQLTQQVARKLVNVRFQRSRANATKAAKRVHECLLLSFQQHFSCRHCVLPHDEAFSKVSRNEIEMIRWSSLALAAGTAQPEQ